MNVGIAVVIPLAIFFALDLIILDNAQNNKQYSESHRVFTWLASMVSIQQGVIAAISLSERDLVSMPCVLLELLHILLFSSMTASAYFWLLYLLKKITGGRRETGRTKFLLSLPADLMMLCCILSPWTHWIFYLDDGGQYYRGSLFALQILLPYSYFLIALLCVFRFGRKTGHKSSMKMLHSFLLFAMPTLVGAYFQFLIYDGGYSQIGVSIALILLYLEQYMEDVNENMQLRGEKLLNDELKRVNEEQARHITEIAELNSVIRTEKDNAEAANRSKTIFLNNMSHDIRTPMNAILGYSKLMEQELNNPEKLADYLSKIEKSGDYLLSIINNTLEVARIDSGKETVDECFTDLMDASCSVAPLLEAEFEKKNLHFENHMDIEHRYVFADMVKIREIVMNLMSNAIKYTPNGGSILLTFVELPSEKEGYATFVNTITDNGIGMSKEFLDHIFDSFTRERNTTESKVLGTGLGMAIVKKLVDLMGGSIEVESQPGKGSTFRVTLSHRIVEDPEKYLESQRTQWDGRVDLSGKRILIAEDNDLNAEIATELLTQLGAVVDCAPDGVMCIDMLDKAQSGYYDLILMDIQMPCMNGYKATETIRNFTDPVKAAIPIVAMTADAFEEDRFRALQAGMNGHIAKPINLPELTKTLAELLG